MNKKGFTLIELITTIAILAIITLIAYPIVNTIINQNKTKLYHEQEIRLAEAAEKYLNENYIDDSSDDVIILKNTLVTQGYINEMYDVGNKTEICDAYAAVTNYLTNPIIKGYISCSGYVSIGFDINKLT